METIEEIYYAFGKNFLFASVMFLPDSLTELVEEDIRENLKDITNVLFIVERNGENYFLDEKRKFCSVHVLSKKALLDDNVFILLKFREEHSEKRFTYVLQRYMEQLGGYKYFSKWLFENAEVYIEDISNDALNAFELQYDAFLKHYKEIKEHFPMEEEKMKSPDLVSSTEKSVAQLGGMIGNKDLNKLIQIIPKDLERPTKSKERTKQLKADIEASADRLILENVFNLKLDKE
jgi:hypothetical protein